MGIFFSFFLVKNRADFFYWLRFKGDREGEGRY